MKTCYLSVAMGLFLAGVGFAEGGGNEDWAEKAAVQYEEKAAKAAADGNAADAAIYLKMAQIKRDAGAAAKTGEKFSWDEYHALSGQLGGGKKDKGEKGKDTKWKDKSDNKKAEHKDKSHDKEAKADKKGKENPGDGFIGAAQEYQKLSIEAAKAGDAGKAGIYAELAKMKLDAAAAANKGEGYDWAKYHELKGKLGE